MAVPLRQLLPQQILPKQRALGRAFAATALAAVLALAGIGSAYAVQHWHFYVNGNGNNYFSAGLGAGSYAGGTWQHSTQSYGSSTTGWLYLQYTNVYSGSFSWAPYDPRWVVMYTTDGLGAVSTNYSNLPFGYSWNQTINAYHKHDVSHAAEIWAYFRQGIGTCSDYSRQTIWRQS